MSRAVRASVTMTKTGPLMDGIRLALRMTHAQVAAAVSTEDDPVSEWVIRAYCSGRRRSMRVDRAGRIAEALQVPVPCIVVPAGHRTVRSARARRADR